MRHGDGEGARTATGWRGLAPWSRRHRGLPPLLPAVMPGRRRLALWSFGSLFSIASLGSVGSALSILSINSAGSILCIGSSGSILSIGSVGSILSIGSAGSILSIGGRGRVRTRGRAPRRAPNADEAEDGAAPGTARYAD